MQPLTPLFSFISLFIDLVTGLGNSIPSSTVHTLYPFLCDAFLYTNVFVETSLLQLSEMKTFTNQIISKN